jgi:TPR repeat protein
MLGIPAVRTRACGILLGLLCVPVPANTPLDDGLRLLEQGEGLRALAALKPLAHDGNAEAQYRLGTIYERGLGILADDYWAWYWYQAAAAQGHTPAVEALRGLAERHPGVLPETLAQQQTPAPDAAAAQSPTVDNTASQAVDAPLAVPDAAPGTTMDAPVDIAADAPAAATLPQTGTVGPVDGGVDGMVVAPGRGELAALERARAAGIEVRFEASQPLPAPRGDAVTGLPTSDGPPARAADSVALPPAPAPAVSAEAPADGTGTAPGSEAAGAPGMTLARLDEGERLRGLPEAELTSLASAGNVVAQRELALRLHAGRGRPKDLPAALAWYRRAAEAGDAEAQYQLGNLYLMGDGIEADDAWAITWFRRAAAQGHAQAEAHLQNLVQLSGGNP